jgi:TRAP transporter TAXI family solute receptor
MPNSAAKKHPKLVTTLIETFGFSPLFATIVALFLVLLAGAALVWLWLSAPPRTIRMLTGPPGSSFDRYARQVEGATPTTRTYEKRLAHRWDLKLQVIPSNGSMDNLKRLAAGEGDVAFVQGGLVGENPPPNLVSLGSVASQPIWIFYRATSRMARLSELAGKRIGVGGPGSGTHALAIDLLTRSGITAATATLVEDDAGDASTALLSGKLDAIFLMGEAASLQTLRTLIRAPEIQLYHFTQADAYVRRIDYLNKIVLPQGAIDFALNLPTQDVVLVGPTVQLLARQGFNGALTDVLLEAAGQVHGRGGLLSRRGEFPAPIKGEYPISPDAERYYKSGLGFTYERVPNFYVASLINRVLVAIVPIALLTIPAIRLLPIAYRWSVQLRIYRCYRPLLRLEREVHSPVTPEEAEELRARLDEIEADVNALKVPASFAYQFYALRGHVNFVRKRLQAVTAA